MSNPLHLAPWSTAQSRRYGTNGRYRLLKRLHGSAVSLRQADRNVGRKLDALNFFLADVRDGLGPYLAIYLLTEQKWDEARIGVVMSIATIAGLVAQTPAGALIDAIRAKRSIMAAAAIVVTAASLLLPLVPGFWPVAASQGLAHAAGVVFAP